MPPLFFILHRLFKNHPKLNDVKTCFFSSDKVLNKATILDKWPIPTINELLDKLNGSHLFFKINLKSSFNQIRVRDEDTKQNCILHT